MGDATGIQWTDATWNPVRGCTRVSEGCRHCYAERVAARFSGLGQPYDGLARMTPDGPRWTGVVRVIEEHLTDPLRWRRPRRVFVNSMSDLFHEALSDAEIDRVFAVMALAPQHVFQVLTKRPERMRAYLATEGRRGVIAASASRPTLPVLRADGDWPLPNVWLGTSVEDQETARERIPVLLDTPAALRFISAEPLLGPIDFAICAGEIVVNVLRGEDGCWPEVPGLDWVIVGGESGPGARPCHVEWIRSVVAQCAAAHVPVFVKQLGARPVVANDAVETWREQLAAPYAGFATGDSLPYQGAPCRVFLHARKGDHPSEWPADLVVREFPA